MTIIDSLHALRANIATVTNSGGSVTTEYERIDARWLDFMGRNNTAAARLAAAIIGTETDDTINTLAGLALAEQASPVQAGSVNLAVATEVYPALRLEYNKVAASNYDVLRESFNAIAQEFTKACKTVDPEAKAETLMDGSDAERKAWATAAVLAPQLTARIPALIAAAKLAGALIMNNDDQLPLTTNPSDSHRRRIWEAWDTTDGRTGRWLALIKAGATIDARPLDQFRSYRRAAEMETRYEQTAIGQRPVLVDPEDKGFTPRDLANKVAVLR